MAAAGERVWSGLLAGARREAGATTVVLGDPGSGKSTLVASLCEKAPKKEAAGALDYTYAHDEHGLVHVYTLHSADASVAATLPYAFPPVREGRASLHAVRGARFVLVLDWHAPWRFVEQLAAWLALVRHVVAGAYAPDEDAVRAAMQDERAHALGGARPLPPGVLTENLGVEITIVLAKSDAVPHLLSERHLTEAQLDYVQQVVRTIAAQYGAGVVATSRQRPGSFDAARAFLATGDGAASTNDAALLCVPRGWDSWSKIAVLDESFSCEDTAAAWAADLGGADVLRTQYAQRVPPPRGAREAQAAVPTPDFRAFLAQLYAQQQASGEAFADDVAGAARNVLGPPVAASTLDMPAVEAALAEQQARPDETPRRTRLTMAAADLESQANSPGVTTPKQTEVLHSFFQSRTSCYLHSPQKAGQPGLRARHAERAAAAQEGRVIGYLCIHSPCRSHRAPRASRGSTRASAAGGPSRGGPRTPRNSRGAARATGRRGRSRAPRRTAHAASARAAGASAA